MEDIIITEWIGITIFRPNNLITNLIVGVIGAILTWKLYQKNSGNSTFLYYWMGFFFFIGLGGAIGGIAHALNYDYPEIKHTYLHKVAWTVAGFGLFFGEMGSLQLLQNKRLQYILQGVMVFKLLFFIFYLYYSQMYLIGNFNHFDIVRFNSAFAVLGVMLPCQIYFYLTQKNVGAFFVIGGIFSLPFTILFYNLKINFAQWFDYNDISHLIEIICLILMFIGISIEHDHLKREDKIKSL